MKRKIYIILFIVFILAAGLAAYKLISDQADYNSSKDYYQSLANNIVEQNSPTEAKTTAVEVTPESKRQRMCRQRSRLIPPRQPKLRNQPIPRRRPIHLRQQLPRHQLKPPYRQKLLYRPIPRRQQKLLYRLKSRYPTKPFCLPIQPFLSNQKQVRNQSVLSETKTLFVTEAPTETSTPAETATPTETAAPTETPAPTATPTVAVTDTPKPFVPVETTLPPPSATLLPFRKITVPKKAPTVRKDPQFTTEQPPISVNFEQLFAMNPEIVGWIYCEDTPINYPVLQCDNNEKYLNTQADGKTNRSGAIFVDCNCNPGFANDNTIMYGHNRRNGMFACLPKFSYQSYYEEHPVMWLLTPEKNYRVDFFAGFSCLANDWVYEINLYPENLRNEFLDRCLQSSNFKSNVDPYASVGIITLSTCHYNGIPDARYVVMGALIPCVEQR